MYQGEVKVSEEDLSSFLRWLKTYSLKHGDHLRDDHQSIVASPKIKRSYVNIQNINDTHFVDHYNKLEVQKNEKNQKIIWQINKQILNLIDENKQLICETSRVNADGHCCKTRI